MRAGKVRYIGASNYSGWQLQKAIDISKANGWEPFVSLQALYNLLDRELEWELLPLAREEGLGVLPWSPLRGGWLSGKYHRGMTAPVAGARIEKASQEGWSETWERYANEFTWNVVDALVAIAKERGKEPAQVALNWLLRQPGVTAPIIGARNMAQLESNIGAAGWALTRGGGRAAERGQRSPAALSLRLPGATPAPADGRPPPGLDLIPRQRSLHKPPPAARLAAGDRGRRGACLETAAARWTRTFRR